jgi:hypothetical protein
MRYRFCPTHAVLSTDDTCWIGGCPTEEHRCWHVPCNGAMGHPTHMAGNWSAEIQAGATAAA